MTKLLLFAIPLTAGLLFGVEPAAKPAPIPAQILSAKKVFLSNVSEDCAFSRAGCAPNLFYNEFYAAMQTWGRYEIATTPSDADLIFELSFSTTFITESPGQQAGVDWKYRLAIIDPKTHTTLWGFAEHVANANREQALVKNHASARGQIFADLKALLAP